MKEALERFRSSFPDTEVKEYNPRRLYLRIVREQLTAAVKLLHREYGMRLSICTAVDTREGFEVLYHFFDDCEGVYYTLKVLAPKDDCWLDSQATWFPACDWIEREMHELFGIEFRGHPNMKPLLTSDTDWSSERYPLRRDAEQRSRAHER